MQLSKEEFQRLGYAAVDMASNYLAQLPAGPVFQRMEESERQALMNMPMPAAPLSGDEILRLMAERILPHPMGNGHPRFFGWVNSPPAMLAVITEILAAAMNPSCAGGDHAAIYLEHCVIRWLMQLLGFPTEGSTGILVSGGSMASLTALAAARYRALSQLGIDVRARGVGGAPSKLRMYASAQVHSCVQKAVELLGLGSECIRWIEVDEDFRMSLDGLRQALQEDRRQGWNPFCIVASAGSVHTGAIDPLNELADIARDAGLWLHVDGAYGAVGILDPSAHPFFAGIERADSIALDPHKWLSVPVECGCVLVRDRALLRDAFSLVPSYIRTEAGKGIGNLPWFSEYGFQQTRGFRALKLWVTLAHAGTSGLKEQIARQISLARYLKRRIQAAPHFELRSRGKLSIVCFRYVPPELAENEEALDTLNKKIMERLQADGSAFLTNTTLAGRFVLRACILHYGTRERDIDTMPQRPSNPRPSKSGRRSDDAHYNSCVHPTKSVLSPDDLSRKLISANPDTGENARHIGLVGDTYTILLSGKETAGQFCLIDMHVPPGGGPPPHRHDFEETFRVLEGEIEATFRGTKMIVGAGETIHIPANAPHQFRNASAKAARLLCICSPAGQEEFFLEVGVPVPTRSTAPPKLDEAAQAAFIAKVQALAPKYRTELLQKA